MEDLIYNSYEKDVAVYGDFEMPVPTYDIDPKTDFSVIVALLLRSNSNPRQDNYRYIDYSKINKKEICEECKISRYTLDRRLEYLQNKNIITAKNTSRGLVYIINYSKNGKYYVTIHHRILKNLLKYTNKDVIKVYVLLKVQCDILGNKKPMTNAFLCSQLGYSPDSKNNLDKIGSWTNTLANTRFIEKIQNRVYKVDEKGNKVIDKVDTYYKVNTLDIWDSKKNKGIIKI